MSVWTTLPDSIVATLPGLGVSAGNASWRDNRFPQL